MEDRALVFVAALIERAMAFRDRGHDELAHLLDLAILCFSKGCPEYARSLIEQAADRLGDGSSALAGVPEPPQREPREESGAYRRRVLF